MYSERGQSKQEMKIATGHTHTSERPSRTCDEHNLARCLEVRIGWVEGGVELSVHGFGELKRFGENVHVE